MNDEYDIAIIGCGPAGLSAAIFCGRTNLKTVVIGIPEKSQLFIAPHIENYFGFPDGIDGPVLLNKGILQISRIGVDLIKDEAVVASTVEANGQKLFIVKTSKGRNITAHSLIIATGVPLKLAGIENEERFTGKSVHYCVWCDAPLYKNKKFAIIGSGNHAAEDAIEALSYTKDVTIISNSDKCSFSESYNKELEKWKIQTICAKVKNFKGEKKLESIVLDDGQEMKFDAVFMACGSAGALDFAANLGLEIKDNVIVVDENNATSIDGVYAAGNCEGRCRQIAKNVGDGCNAALSAVRYLRPRKLYFDYGHNDAVKTAENKTTDDAKETQAKEERNKEDSFAEEKIVEDKNIGEIPEQDVSKPEPLVQKITPNTQEKTKEEKRKLRIGWFTFSCCEDSTIVFTEMLNDHWDEWKNLVDIRYCRALKKNNDMTDLDVAFVEGAISNDKAAQELRSIRLNAQKIVAIGACAATGMPSGQRNEFDDRRKREIEPVIRAFDYKKSVSPVHDIVRVDDTVPGCPMIEAVFLNVINKYLKELDIHA